MQRSVVRTVLTFKTYLVVPLHRKGYDLVTYMNDNLKKSLENNVFAGFATEAAVYYGATMITQAELEDVTYTEPEFEGGQNDTYSRLSGGAAAGVIIGGIVIAIIIGAIIYYVSFRLTKTTE